MPSESGQDDFIVARTAVEENPGIANFVPSYHWACAIDDSDGNYKLLVRAWDLESAVKSQQAIQKWLCPDSKLIPDVFHAALITNDDGSRLEKRTRGVTLFEVRQAGVTPQLLVHAFEKSFSWREEWLKSGGEPRRAIPLSELMQLTKTQEL